MLERTTSTFTFVSIYTVLGKGFYLMTKQQLILSLSDHGNLNQLSSTLNPTINWIQNDMQTFCKPFVNGTQQAETFLAGQSECFANRTTFSSESGRTTVRLTLKDDCLCFDAQMPTLVGPRVGLDFPFNFLDSQGDGWENQCMPHVIYTDENHRFCYLIFYNPQAGYLSLVVEDSFAAWRIKYSKNGHRMTGFQLLNEADDLIGGKGIISNSLHGRLFVTASLTEAYDQLASILGMAIVSYPLSGGLVGNTIPLTIHGTAESIRIIGPSNTKPFQANVTQLPLLEEGIYTIITEGSHHSHTTSLTCLKKWEDYSLPAGKFYRKHFQDETGAFYRSIWSDTRSPKDGITYEGIAFGDPTKMVSCKTGEFGGFAGWMMIKEALRFNENQEVAQLASQRYIENWALNWSHPHAPRPGSIAAFPQVFAGREYGAYHVYHDFNYPQYEIFLIEQLCDYYQLTKDANILAFTEEIGKHFVKEHIDPATGAVWCQNKPTSLKRDYSTVHTPVTGLHKLAKITTGQTSNLLLTAAEKLADHICKRGLHFPTEGEQATEDGSMACSALSLLYAYHYIKPKPAYLSMAENILDKHRVLEMNGTDSKMFLSSLRFWETMYETRDWGPSINAGHAWTIWTAEAKLLYAEITGNFTALKEAYGAFIATLNKFEDSGGIRCCYTPDLIPGTPHPYDIYLEEEIQVGNFLDIFETSTTYARDFPKKTYSTSGTYTLIKAQEYWYRLAGISLKEHLGINCTFSDDTVRLPIENNGCLFIETDKNPYSLSIIVSPDVHQMTVMVDLVEDNQLFFENCSWEKQEQCYLLTLEENNFRIHKR